MAMSDYYLSIELVKTLKGIRRGLDQTKEGQGKTAESFFC
jgi:hypothetical protein